MFSGIFRHLLAGIGKTVVLDNRIESRLFRSFLLPARPRVVLFPIVNLELPRLYLVKKAHAKEGANKLPRLQRPIDSKLDVVDVHAIQVAVWLICGNPQD